MPKVFGKIKISSNDGRGEGTDGMLENFISDPNKYEKALKMFNEDCSASDQQEFVNKLNEVSDGLGDAFKEGKDSFLGASTDILNHEAFFEALKELGFEVTM